MTKEISHNIPDEELAGVLALYEAQSWTVLSTEQKPGGWTVIAVCPSHPEAPNNAPGGGGDSGGGSSSGSAPAGGGGGAGGGSTPSATGAAVAGTGNDALTLARTIFGEARGEPDDGKEAVANVVVNRLKSGRFPRRASDPKTLAGVCLERLQFSCWNANDPNSSKIANLQKGSSDVFDMCLAIAGKAAAGALADRTDNATHYYADSIAQPSWAKPPAVMTIKIGHHLFFKNVA